LLLWTAKVLTVKKDELGVNTSEQNWLPVLAKGEMHLTLYINPCKFIFPINPFYNYCNKNILYIYIASILPLQIL